MNKLTLLSIGSDPEMFVVNGNTPISAIGLMPGSKENPHKITDNESIQVDNVAVEFNTKPTLSPKQFIESLGTCYKWTDDHLKKINKDYGLLITPSVEFDKDQLKSRKARQFGCEMDFNAWTMMANTPPPSTGTLRSCGGHIHLGLKVENGEGIDFSDYDYITLVRLLDKNVGVYCASICGDTKRASLYGKAGCYRLKSYGLEYRTPSNTWITKEEYISEVFRRVSLTVNEFNAGVEVDYEAQFIIDAADMSLAKDYLTPREKVEV